MQRKERKRMSKKMKWLIAILLLAAAAFCVWFFVIRDKDDAGKPVDMTDVVVRQNLDTTYNTSGTLALKNQKAENAMTDASASYRVKEVNVKVGDAVKAGDVLYTLDMTDVETQQSVAKQKLANTQAQNDLATKAANRDLSSAKAAQSQTAADSAASVKAANETVNKAQSALSAAEKELAEAKKQEQEAYDNLKKQAASAGESANTEEADDADDAKAVYEAAVERRKTAQESVQSAQDTLATANAGLREANSTAKSNNRTAADDVAAKQDALANQKLTNQTSIADQQQEIKKNEEILKHGVVRASTDGTVTEVNVQAGSVYAGDRAVVIGDVSHLMVLVEVESSHVPDIKEGMTVEFTTDATGEEILSGLVTFVSPVPTAGTETTTTNADGTTSVVPASEPASSGGKVTHRVEVSLGDINERLRVGMKAKVNFILERIPDVLCVTTEAIQYDEDGSSYLMVQDPETEEKTKVPVETGMVSDTYTEIVSGEVNEDDIVVYTIVDSGEGADSDALEGIY